MRLWTRPTRPCSSMMFFPCCQHSLKAGGFCIPGVRSRFKNGQTLLIVTTHRCSMIFIDFGMFILVKVDTNSSCLYAPATPSMNESINHFMNFKKSLMTLFLFVYPPHRVPPPSGESTCTQGTRMKEKVEHSKTERQTMEKNTVFFSPGTPFPPSKTAQKRRPMLLNLAAFAVKATVARHDS